MPKLSSTAYSIRPAMDEDRQKLANLMHFELNVHRHLDWRSPIDWIGFQPFLLLETEGVLRGALACPEDPPWVAWVQFFAASSGFESLPDTWQILWERTRLELMRRQINHFAAIPLQSWFMELIVSSHFEHTHDVVVLSWDYSAARSRPQTPPLLIRPMQMEDLENVTDIDSAAFRPIWRNSFESLQTALKQAAVATVVQDPSSREIIAYQISTSSPIGGHLARLAVHPLRQGQNIGYALVYDLIRQFERSGVFRITVNTQHDNTASLKLYEKAGFRKTGETFPVYESHSAGGILGG